MNPHDSAKSPVWLSSHNPEHCVKEKEVNEMKMAVKELGGKCMEK